MGRTACTEPQCLYSRAIPLLPLWTLRPVQSLSVCKVEQYLYSPQCLYKGEFYLYLYRPFYLYMLMYYRTGNWRLLAFWHYTRSIGPLLLNTGFYNMFSKDTSPKTNSVRHRNALAFGREFPEYLPQRSKQNKSLSFRVAVYNSAARSMWQTTYGRTNKSGDVPTVFVRRYFRVTSLV
jgi:hypothetical protein